ncbi:MAG: protein-L-isoaspartate(D-aspartate) O-methyltransferase [Rhizobiaceae bacterium]|nr:protein-L-isoaspartate(D-aspartate) O-methyltransferase [Rhizobiaceae bacterium]MCV0407492.1 protein-L-isoaspartate(D-aspartate) O-methyltransferase [Rhizobiaceae bacterium]
MSDFERSRADMVETQIAGRGVSDEAVLDAMRGVRREDFVETGFEEFAYEDSALPLTEGQTISQPYVVARMIEAAELKAVDRVLEVGTGSGYSAAVLSLIAQHVFTIERHQALGETARDRLAAMGFANVTVRIGDGSLGWPEEAPFDAIIVAAGGPSLPLALRDQLEIGGRLVIPVGDRRSQRLLRIVRLDAKRFEEEDLGAVAFVPLIGSQGWQNGGSGHQDRNRRPPALPQKIAQAAEDLPDPDDPAFGEFFDRFADRRVLLLGEASHGTSEFYRARAAITRRMIEKHGFTIVAVEADWPDAASVNRYIRNLPLEPGQEAPFKRFPTWMWRNTDFDDFLKWLRTHNSTVDRQTSFHGLDLYNMRGAIASILAYLDEVDPDAAAIARERYGCLTPWHHDPAIYGRAVLTESYRSCEAAVVAQCRDLLEKELRYASDNGADFLDASQNARLVAAAEQYYRVMYYGGPHAWNLRDRHMFETLDHVLAASGPEAKAVVWAHNSHIGDARHTEMGRVRDELNIGQLCRERFGADAASIGFGTNTGTVAAASRWDGPVEFMTVRPSSEESAERCFHLAGRPRCMVDFSRHHALTEALAEPRLQRFIGVIYRPESELLSHYAQASISKQYDAYVWLDQTRAVTPLPAAEAVHDGPETFPFGL